MEFAIWPQDLLTRWVIYSLIVGLALLVGGARAPGAALAGSSFCSVLAYLLSRTYGGDHLETLVHGAVILGSVGLVGFGLGGLALGTNAPLGRFPMALVLAIGTAAVGVRLVLGIHAGAALPCSPQLCYRGFEEPWVQWLLAFNFAFVASLFLVQAWRASRSSEVDDPLAGRPIILPAYPPGNRARQRFSRPPRLHEQLSVGLSSLHPPAETMAGTDDHVASGHVISLPQPMIGQTRAGRRFRGGEG
jgi:hypothetical protein